MNFTGVHSVQRQILRRYAVNLSVCFSVLIGTSANAEWSDRNPLFQKLLTEASQVSGLPMVRDMRVDVQAVSKSELLNRTCPNRSRCGDVVASYLINEGRIIYDSSLNLSGDVGKSFLVHEFVHVLQHLRQGSSVNEDCMTIHRNEMAAYSAQARWLSERGIFVQIRNSLKLKCSLD